MISVTNPSVPTTPRCPAVLVDPDHLHPGQPIRPGRGDQVGGRTHRDRADGMPGHPQLGGDGRDGGAVDHQPPQHIPGTPPRRRRPRGRQLAQVLVEHRPPTLGSGSGSGVRPPAAPAGSRPPADRSAAGSRCRGSGRRGRSPDTADPGPPARRRSSSASRRRRRR